MGWFMQLVLSSHKGLQGFVCMCNQELEIQGREGSCRLQAGAGASGGRGSRAGTLLPNCHLVPHLQQAKTVPGVCTRP